MKLEDRFVIEAPTHVVWKFFLDIPQVATCVPGVEIVDQLDEENINSEKTSVMKIEYLPIQQP